MDRERRSPDYEALVRNPNGLLSVPWIRLDLELNHYRLLRISQGAAPRVPTRAQRRALRGASEIVERLLLLSVRIGAHLDLGEAGRWVDVRFPEFMLDMQSLFLFCQQYLEDVAHVIRCSFVGEHASPAARFRKSRETLLKLPELQSDPLLVFLQVEDEWFSEFADLRDDICHRTTADRLRREFPEMIEVLRATRGLQPFAGRPSLREYVSEVFLRCLALGYLGEEFVTKRLESRLDGLQIKRSPTYLVSAESRPPSLLDNPDFRIPGCMVMTAPRAEIAALDRLLRPLPTE